MKRLCGYVNDSKYFTYFAVLILAVIKLLSDNLKSNDIFLHFEPLAKTIVTYTYIAAVVHFILFLLTIGVIFLLFGKSYDQWEQDNKGTKVEILLNAIIARPVLVTLVIMVYGFYIYLTTSVFSWTYFFIFFGAGVIAKTIRNLNDLMKRRSQQHT